MHLPTRSWSRFGLARAGGDVSVSLKPHLRRAVDWVPAEFPLVRFAQRTAPG